MQCRRAAGESCPRSEEEARRLAPASARKRLQLDARSTEPGDALSAQRAIYLTQAEHDDMGDLRVGPRARVPPSRASHTAAGARFALTEARLLTTAVNLTQVDSPLRA
jgi:hypothetical protein